MKRHFKLWYKYLGRAGREHEKGRVFIQTYNPDNYAIELSKKQDYLTFYNSEIQLRKRLNYPPFCDIIVIKFTGKNVEEVKKCSNQVYHHLKKCIKENEAKVYKPVPSPIDKIKNSYRWRMIVKGKVNLLLLEKIDKAIKIDNKNISLVVDINPNNMM